jgi:glycopeptide antibiotics resistance protein
MLQGVYCSIVIIFASAVAGRQLWNVVRSLVSQIYLPVILWGVFAVVALVLVIKTLHSLTTLLICMSVATIGLLCAAQLSIPEERLHLLLFGTLGFFAFFPTKQHSFTRAFMIVLLVACLDESLQALLPYRIGDLRDIGFNAVGGIWGMVTAGIYHRSSKLKLDHNSFSPIR